jgi:3-methyladenine DNA glycosylase AlkD
MARGRRRDPRCLRLGGNVDGLHVEEVREVVLVIPILRRAVKEGYSFVSKSRSENLVIWDYLWRHGAYNEVMHQALYFYQHRELNRDEAKTIRGWMERCACWEHCDDLSKIYAMVVEANPVWIMPTLRKWNRSRDLWKRRQSMVSLIEYASKRKRFLPFAELIAFIEPLLDDEEYYVQKGLGWTLREIGNAYPDQGARFIEQHARRLAPQAWTGATKNLGKEEKSRLRAIRDAGPRLV